MEDNVCNDDLADAPGAPDAPDAEGLPLGLPDDVDKSLILGRRKLLDMALSALNLAEELSS